jgi:lipoprotein-anchoring transpeptidase ErfK/SrfK
MFAIGRLIIVLVIGFTAWGVLSQSLALQSKGQEANVCGRQDTAGIFENDLTAYWMGKSVNTIAQLPESSQVLGSADESKWIEVDLSDQLLTAHQGDRVVYQTKISSGKFGRTPAGEFRIWIKLRYTKMEGGTKGTNTYYYLPNVPYTMFFYNDNVAKWKGYGLHGTYWHNNFGTPMSHGCVNLPTEMAGLLFNWTDPQVPAGKGIARAQEPTDGTKIVIHE